MCAEWDVFIQLMTYQIVTLSSPNPPGCRLWVLRDCQSRRVCFSLWFILVLFSSWSILLWKPRWVVSSKPLMLLIHVISNYARDSESSTWQWLVTVVTSFLNIAHSGHCGKLSLNPTKLMVYFSGKLFFPFLLFLDSPPTPHASMSGCILPGDDYNDIHTIWNRSYTRENGSVYNRWGHYLQR